MTHIKQLVMPYVKKLKESTLTQIQQMFLGFIESNLTGLATPLLKNLHAFRLTSHQLEIATLIRGDGDKRHRSHPEHERTGGGDTKVFHTKETRHQQGQYKPAGLSQIFFIVSKYS